MIGVGAWISCVGSERAGKGGGCALDLDCWRVGKDGKERSMAAGQRRS
jgi:hypothetical protein